MKTFSFLVFYFSKISEAAFIDGGNGGTFTSISDFVSDIVDFFFSFFFWLKENKNMASLKRGRI